MDITCDAPDCERSITTLTLGLNPRDREEGYFTCPEHSPRSE